MQARSGEKRILGYKPKHNAHIWAGQRNMGRCAVFLCGLLFCFIAAAAALRACAARQPPAGCSLKSYQAAYVFPIDTQAWRVPSGYGWRDDPLGDEDEFHKGVDLACAAGTPVLAAASGVVCRAQRSTSYGNYICLRHADATETLYAHLQYIYVRAGEVVEESQVLGTVGQTGKATGPHLHFELIADTIHYDPTAALKLPQNG